MTEQPTGNLVLVLGAFFGAMRTGSTDPIRDVLSPDIVWKGRFPGLECSGPDAVIGFLSRGLLQGRRITKLEGSESGDQVAITAYGPDFEDFNPADYEDPPAEPTMRESATLIFTVRDGLIVHMQG